MWLIGGHKVKEKIFSSLFLWACQVCFWKGEGSLVIGVCISFASEVKHTVVEGYCFFQSQLQKLFVSSVLVLVECKCLVRDDLCS